MEINSKEYWNYRFETDWNEFGGDNQTIFFANTLCNMLPKWFVDEVMSNKYSVCDLGCAHGDALPIWNNLFGNVSVCGEDFSEAAISDARKKYPEFMFLVSDIMEPEGKRQYDVVISSNTVEHFKNTKEVLKNICRRSKRYTVIMLPYREDEQLTKEHEVIFHTDRIPYFIEDNVLIYARTCQCSSQYYPGEQILLIFSKDAKETVLSDIVEHINSDSYKKLENEFQDAQKRYRELENEYKMLCEKKDKLEHEKAALEHEKGSLWSRNTQLENERAALEDEKERCQSRNEELENEKIVLEGEKVKLQNRNAELENEKIALEDEKAKLQSRNAELENEKGIAQSRNAELKNEKAVLENEKAIIQNTNAELESEISELKKAQEVLNKNNAGLTYELEMSKFMLEHSEKKRIDLENRIGRAIAMCKDLTNWGLYKASHMLHRTKHQLFNKSGSERKKYIHWLSNWLKGNGTDTDYRFKPVYRVIDILKEQENEIEINISDSKIKNHIQEEKERLSDGNIDIEEVNGIKEILDTHQYKGIMVYPHVVYWEPLQTPQQLLRAFAKLGWLCFFCEYPYLKDVFREVEQNVVIVHEKEFLYVIGNREVTVLLTWIGSLAFVNKLKNKRIWYHILDKLELFLYYDDSYLELHNQVIRSVDCVSYVAEALEECISDRDDAIYLPNGVNPEEFIKIHKDFIPKDMEDIIKTGHKVIGYYGYLAEWMDYDMVRRIALARPNYEFVFIGKAVCDTSLLEGISNIHLLGLKAYDALSDYAKLFDVAMIPFVINETMDCVSPIKFYEYCALGLPVVTSKMKELEKYACEYVGCADGYDEFLFFLDKLTDKQYKDKAAERAPLIAKANTWLSRAKMIQINYNKELSIALEQEYQKFDVIVLGVIDYDFRFQRPQQLAVRYAQNGHRVFYFNANHYHESSLFEIQENLYVINIHNDKYTAIHLTDWDTQMSKLITQMKKVIDSYCVRDAITIVDYPNWIYAAEFLRKEYGFKIITDYMDDFTGFLNPAEQLVRQNCEKLLRISDGVIASSEFLYDIAVRYNQNVSIVRNGTEFEHFHVASGAVEHAKKVIGYYGAVAEWFQTDKVVYLAKNLPECEIIIIGDVTKGEAVLKKYSNIKLLGEKPYSELPKFLKEFDVCIIPFDTSSDLIKATNPVKFYEYLSAGKKIVSTEIPELEEYRDKYVYMANDNQKFLEYVKLCLLGTDVLYSAEECIRFAKQHDWQERYEAFYKNIIKVIPKINVIVLTYNNLEINQLCIKSILEKTAYPNYELIIVDNCSTDGTREYLSRLAQEKSHVKVLLNDENLGFAAGNNVGMKQADGAYIVLLNNDTLITRGWLTTLAKHMENNKMLGMCGPVTNSIGNEAKIKVDYHSMRELERFAYDYTTRHLGEEYQNVHVLAFFCTIIRKNVVEECGYLDESYGIGMFEDDDYAETVKSRGYSLTIAEDAFIHHFHGVSFNKLEDEQFQKVFSQNKEKYQKKWNKNWIPHKHRQGVNYMDNSGCLDVFNSSSL